MNNAQTTEPSLRLAGRRVVITGAASGIGRSTADLFVAEGATVALIDRDRDSLNAVASKLGGHAFAADITNDDAVATAVSAAAEALGGIDGVVHAAGIMFRGRAEDTPASEWRKVIDINLTGTYNILRSAIPFLTREADASVVTLASAAGLLPNSPEYTAYAASKGGVLALSKAFAAELAPGVRVNTVCPGMVDTAMADGYRQHAENYALKRLADPSEIAAAARFLISRESSYVTGSTLTVDGGRTFH